MNNLETAKEEHKEAERDLDFSLQELISAKNINVNLKRDDTAPQLPEAFNEIVLNKSCGILGVRSNTESLKVIEKIVLNLNKAGLFTNSCPNYIQ